jgi:hypothetical protein
MYGISSIGKDSLNKIVEDIFDNIALQLIGDIPRLQDKKRLVISASTNFGLPHLFVQAMKNKTPNAIEKDVLKSLLTTSYGHIESLKHKTTSNITERLDGIARESKLRKRKIKKEEIEAVVNEEFGKAKSNLEAIAEYESTKLRNLGTMMDITSVASSVGDEDPSVFFVVIKDNVTCKECIRLHLMPDQITPRIWKLSELKQAYHKRGTDAPSAFGLHPFCRCTLVYLTRGFGFDKTGKLTYKESDYDAYLEQKE